MPTITTFATPLDRGRGLARDFRVRWALEEVDQPYEVRLVSMKEMKEPAHRALQPFGSIPTYEDGDVALFESGAIVLHIAETHAGLLPEAPAARARAITWLFAAVGTIEPATFEFAWARVFEASQPWAAERLPLVEGRVRPTFAALEDLLSDTEWLEGAFSAGDLMMIAVLMRLGPSGYLAEFPALAAYVAKGEARPAFRRAFADQLALFTASQTH